MLLDGLNLQQIAPATLRTTVQLVPQEAVLFSGTLAENIAFGKAGARDEDILRAARDAGVDRIAAAHLRDELRVGDDRRSERAVGHDHLRAATELGTEHALEERAAQRRFLQCRDQRSQLLDLLAVLVLALGLAGVLEKLREDRV